MSAKQFVIKECEEDTLTEEEYNNPLDISEILAICAEYSNLSWKNQAQIQVLLDKGIDSLMIDASDLSIIKNFLKKISDNFYFGDASEQAKVCLDQIQLLELKSNIGVSIGTN